MYARSPPLFNAPPIIIIVSPSLWITLYAEFQLTLKQHWGLGAPSPEQSKILKYHFAL